MGYQGALRPMLNGEITSLRPSFPSGGGSTLAVSGLNILHRFRTKQEIAHLHRARPTARSPSRSPRRLKVNVETHASTDEPTFNYLIQDNQYDIIFLMERARRAGYDLFVEERKAAAVDAAPSSSTGRRPRCTTPTYRLTYGKSLIEFQPELTTANQVGKVTVRGWDAMQQGSHHLHRQRARSWQLKGVGDRGGQAAIEKSIEQKAEIIATKPVESLDGGPASWRSQILEGIAKEMVKATGSVPGLPDIRAGTVLEIDGVGDRFSGRYFVVSTTHAIGDSGYTTQFECRREEV